MSETFKLKPISESGVEEAIKRAEHYRLLNDPAQAESICRDVLRVHPGHPRALVVIILALTDQFTDAGQSPGVRTAREYANRLESEYERAYYSGVICERQARALLIKGMARAFAYDGLREAMDWYEKAEPLRAEGHDDAILRWNACVRTIRRASLRPRDDDDELPLE